MDRRGTVFEGTTLAANPEIHPVSERADEIIANPVPAVGPRDKI
jgi:hypothetical protein